MNKFRYDVAQSHSPLTSTSPRGRHIHTPTCTGRQRTRNLNVNEAEGQGRGVFFFFFFLSDLCWSGSWDSWLMSVLWLNVKHLHSNPTQLISWVKGMYSTQFVGTHGNYVKVIGQEMNYLYVVESLGLYLTVHLPIGRYDRRVFHRYLPDYTLWISF